MALLWLATLGFLSQYFLSMMIERYTLATGETAVTGFSRFRKPWGIVFVLGAILPNAFPGWAASAATLLTYLCPRSTSFATSVKVGPMGGDAAIGCWQAP